MTDLSSPRRRWRSRSFAVACLAAAISAPAHAQTVFWDLPTSGNWSNRLGWSTLTLPGTTSAVVNRSRTAITLDLNATIRSFSSTSTLNLNRTLTGLSGNTLSTFSNTGFTNFRGGGLSQFLVDGSQPALFTFDTNAANSMRGLRFRGRTTLSGGSGTLHDTSVVEGTLTLSNTTQQLAGGAVLDLTSTGAVVGEGTLSGSGSINNAGTIRGDGSGINLRAVTTGVAGAKIEAGTGRVRFQSGSRLLGMFDAITGDLDGGEIGSTSAAANITFTSSAGNLLRNAIFNGNTAFQGGESRIFGTTDFNGTVDFDGTTFNILSGSLLRIPSGASVTGTGSLWSADSSATVEVGGRLSSGSGDLFITGNVVGSNGLINGPIVQTGGRVSGAFNSLGLGMAGGTLSGRHLATSVTLLPSTTSTFDGLQIPGSYSINGPGAAVVKGGLSIESSGVISGAQLRLDSDLNLSGTMRGTGSIGRSAGTGNVLLSGLLFGIGGTLSVSAPIVGSGGRLRSGVLASSSLTGSFATIQATLDGATLAANVAGASDLTFTSNQSILTNPTFGENATFRDGFAGANGAVTFGSNLTLAGTQLQVAAGSSLVMPATGSISGYGRLRANVTGPGFVLAGRRIQGVGGTLDLSTTIQGRDTEIIGSTELARDGTLKGTFGPSTFTATGGNIEASMRGATITLSDVAFATNSTFRDTSLIGGFFLPVFSTFEGGLNLAGTTVAAGDAPTTFALGSVVTGTGTLETSGSSSVFDLQGTINGGISILGLLAGNAGVLRGATSVGGTGRIRGTFVDSSFLMTSTATATNAQFTNTTIRFGTGTQTLANVAFQGGTRFRDVGSVQVTGQSHLNSGTLENISMGPSAPIAILDASSLRVAPAAEFAYDPGFTTTGTGVLINAGMVSFANVRGNMRGEGGSFAAVQLLGGAKTSGTFSAGLATLNGGELGGTFGSLNLTVADNASNVIRDATFDGPAWLGGGRADVGGTVTIAQDTTTLAGTTLNLLSSAALMVPAGATLEGTGRVNNFANQQQVIVGGRVQSAGGPLTFVTTLNGTGGTLTGGEVLIGGSSRVVGDWAQVDATFQGGSMIRDFTGGGGELNFVAGTPGTATAILDATFRGDTRLVGSGPVTFAPGPVSIEGTMDWLGVNAGSVRNAQINVGPSGHLRMFGSLRGPSRGDSSFNVDGVFETTGAVSVGPNVVTRFSGTQTIHAGHSLRVDGSIQATAGTTIVDGTLRVIGAPLSVTGGALLGNGTIDGSVNIGPLGAVNPGRVGSTGTLTITDSMLLEGALRIDVTNLGTPTSDTVAVGGAVTLGGALVLDELPGSPWVPHARFRILTATGGVTQMFAAEPDSRRWTVIYGSDFVDVQAVPEPGTLVALGLGALALRRRRRSSRESGRA